GRYFFLYHAYAKDGDVYTGRQGLLSEVVWNEETGWPEFKEGSVEAHQEILSRDSKIEEDFSSSMLAPSWQWPVGEKPDFTLKSGTIKLQASRENIGSVLAQRILTPD